MIYSKAAAFLELFKFALEEGLSRDLWKSLSTECEPCFVQLKKDQEDLVKKSNTMTKDQFNKAIKELTNKAHANFRSAVEKKWQKGLTNKQDASGLIKYILFEILT